MVEIVHQTTRMHMALLELLTLEEVVVETLQLLLIMQLVVLQMVLLVDLESLLLGINYRRLLWNITQK